MLQPYEILKTTSERWCVCNLFYV